jgi:hypothetical protein
MAETALDLYDESLTAVRAAIIASKLSDDAVVSFTQNDDNEITRVSVRFTDAVWNECDELIREQGFIISPKSARKNFIEVFSHV